MNIFIFSFHFYAVELPVLRTHYNNTPGVRHADRRLGYAYNYGWLPYSLEQECSIWKSYWVLSLGAYAFLVLNKSDNANAMCIFECCNI